MSELGWPFHVIEVLDHNMQRVGLLACRVRRIRL